MKCSKKLIGSCVPYLQAVTVSLLLAYNALGGECFSNKEVSFPSTAKNITIAGTLSVPVGKGPFPAVLMITGNGPHTRDQMISNSPMFKMIGDHFAKGGFVVLRTDARGYGKSTGPNDWEQYTTADRVEDNRAALAFLRKQIEVNKDKIVLFGHSEGAMIAASIAAADAKIALSILLAPAVFRGDEVIARQLEGSLVRRGASTQTGAAVRDSFVKFARFAANGGADGEEFDKLALEFLSAHGVEKEKLDLKLARGLLDGYLKSKWYRYFFAMDPSEDLSRITTPIYAIFAGEDKQVEWQHHGPALVAALAKANNQDTTLTVIPDQDHFFFEFKGKRAEKHIPGKMTVADELFTRLDAYMNQKRRMEPCQGAGNESADALGQIKKGK